MQDAVGGRLGPWLCRHHRVAGGTADARCCHRGAPLDSAAERGSWFKLRLASKPLEVLEAIGSAAGDPQFCLGVLARNATVLGHRWSWGRATARPPSASRETQSIRVLRAS